MPPSFRRHYNTSGTALSTTKPEIGCGATTLPWVESPVFDSTARTPACSGRARVSRWIFPAAKRIISHAQGSYGGRAKSSAWEPPAGGYRFGRYAEVCGLEKRCAAHDKRRQQAINEFAFRCGFGRGYHASTWYAMTTGNKIRVPSACIAAVGERCGGTRHAITTGNK